MTLSYGFKMSHLKEYKSDVAAPDGRSLGDEWADWDGKGGTTIRESKGLFLCAAAAVVIIVDAALALFIYMISPRLESWAGWLPALTWTLGGLFILSTAILIVSLVITSRGERNFFPLRGSVGLAFSMVFSRAFRIGTMFGVTRDRMGHSFVLVSNAISRAMKPKGRSEKLLILLPRCLAKEELQAINGLKEKYPLEVHTVSGGELARKKVRELRPTAVIGVACERDLVSGIRDVGQKISVIGIPNQRPEGPCRNTRIDMDELIKAIEFYVGKPTKEAQS